MLQWVESGAFDNAPVLESEKSLSPLIEAGTWNTGSLPRATSRWHCPKQRHTRGFPGWAGTEAVQRITLAKVLDGRMKEKTACEEKGKEVKKHQSDPHEHW